MLQRKLGPLRESGSTIFDNSKAGKFTPRTSGRLRSAWGNDGVDYYKFCSSMLSSAVDLQGELSQAPANVESIAAQPKKTGRGRMELQETGRTSQWKVAE